MKKNYRLMTFAGCLLLAFISQLWALQDNSTNLQLESKPALSSQKPAVLFMIRKVDPTFKTMLEKEGFVVHEGRPGRGLELTWELLKQFNVLVLSEWHERFHGVTDFTKMPEKFAETYAPAIRKFLENGGGILAGCGGTYGGTLLMDAASQTIFMEEWGAKLTPQGVEDPAAEQQGFIYTDQIAPSPVSDGVKGLWLSHDGIRPTLFGPEWTVVVRASKTAYSRKFEVNHPYFDNKAKEDPVFDASPPIFGIREYQKGRIAAHTIGDLYGYGAGYFHRWNGIQMEKGFGNKKSDYAKLIINTLHWLAGPSLKTGALGGYSTPAEKPHTGPPEVFAKKGPDWSKLGFRGNYKYNFRGVIGLTSKYGGGKAGVAEYAVAAKKLGLDFIAFLDPLEKLGPDGWDKLKADCKAASTTNLVVYPGMRYLDDVGNNKFLLADYLPWPDAFLTPEHRMKYRTEKAYFFLQYNEPILGIYKTKSNPNPAWDQRLYNSIAVMTYENGSLTDECFADYQYAAWNYLNLRPYSIDLIDSVEGLEKAINDKHMLNVIQGNRIEDVREEFFNSSPGGGYRGKGYRWFAYKYISNGPRILAWHILNDTRVTSGDYWLKGSQRVRVRLQAESDIPLKHALIYDGARLVRRYKADGNKLSQDIEFTHDNQSGYIAVVEDIQGNRAVSDDRVATDFLLYDLYCADRMNATPLSWLKTRDGDVVFHEFPSQCHGSLNDESLLPGIEQEAFCPPGGYLDTVGLAGPNGPEFRLDTTEGREEFVCHKIDRILTSADALIKTSSIHHKYPPNVKRSNGWEVNYPLTPTEFVDMDYRMTWFAYRLFGHATGLMEGTVTFKKDVTLKNPVPIFYISQYSKVEPDKYDHFTISTPTKTYAGKVPLSGQQAIGSSGAFPVGSYVTLFPALYGSSTIFALSGGLTYYHSAGEDTNRAEIRVGQAGQNVKKGTVWNFRLLGLRGQTSQPADNREAEDFRRYFFGDDGKKGYVITPMHGQTKDTVFPVELQAEEGFFAGTVAHQQSPVIDLPLLVHGVDKDWSVILYDETENRMRILAVVEKKAYCALDSRYIKGKFYIGYPVMTDNPELILTLVDEGEDHYSVELHNPTEKDIKSELKTAEWCVNLLPKKGQAVEVPAMSSMVVKLK